MRYSGHSVRVLLGACLLLIILASPWAAQAGEEDWPRRVVTGEGTLILYEPEYDRFSETELTGRAALGWDTGGEAGPLFGALWFTARTQTDREARRVQVLDAQVTDVRFPGDPAKDLPPIGRILEDEIPRWGWALSLDDLTHKLALREKERQAAQNLSSLPPKILLSTTPATLILLDGEPEWRPIEGSHLLRAVNTPALIVLEPATGRHYLNSGEDWMRAEALAGPWEAAPDPPDEIAALARRDETAAEELPPQDPRLPRIVVATEPTELIVTDGEPRYKLFAGSELLYISNTDSDVLLDIASQRHYLLLSGRWFSGWSLEGPWSFVPADGLPASFRKIPEDSPKAHLLNHVAGTPEAALAVKDAQVPRIAAVNRHEASLEVVYDGFPRFEPIEGTGMRYAVNTQTPVIEIRGRYYAVEDGVWFTAQDPQGPWTVADSVPDEILTLPPDSPVYHTKFVRVYDSTPDVVYVGYTPGYLGGYVYHGTVVYGTGYYYRPWIGAYFYPWPYTWGFNAYYDPWYGWGFGWGFLFWYGWGAHHHHYDHHHHIYTHHHHRPPYHESILHRSTRWWGAGGYRAFDRKHDEFDVRRKIRKDDGGIIEKRRSTIDRVFPSPRPERFEAPKPGKRDFRDGMNRRDKIDPGIEPPRQKPRGTKDKIREPRKNYFTDRYNKKDRIRPEPEREFPREFKSREKEGLRQKGGGFSRPDKRLPGAGDSGGKAPSSSRSYEHKPRFSQPPQSRGVQPAPQRPSKSFKGQDPSSSRSYEHKPRFSQPPKSRDVQPAPQRPSKSFKGQAPSLGREKSSASGPKIRSPGKHFDHGGSSKRNSKAFDSWGRNK